jgi:hypothetical protein
MVCTLGGVREELDADVNIRYLLLALDAQLYPFLTDSERLPGDHLELECLF